MAQKYLKRIRRVATGSPYIITGLIVVVCIGLIVASANGSEESGEDASQSETRQVEVIRLNGTQQGGSVIEASGAVTSELDAQISPQLSGVVRRVPVAVGEQVAQGDILIELENADIRAQVAQARASLQAQEARLQELQVGATAEEVSIARNNVENARISLESARESVDSAYMSLLNNSLQAYLADGSEPSGSTELSYTPPTITGTYTGDEQGEYRITLYSSGARSGYSFRYFGLESGTGPVSTRSPVPLGTWGLMIEFPENFARGNALEWVVPIPNVNASTYTQSKNAFDQAESAVGNAEVQLELQETRLQQTLQGARQEQLSAQRAQVAQAQASLENAQAQLGKTIIRAPFAGSVTSVVPKVGEYISPGAPVVSLVNASNRYVSVSVSPQVVGRLSVGNKAALRDGSESGEIIRIAQGVSQANGQVEVVVALNQEAKVVAGQYVTLEITAQPAGENQIALLPLSAVQAQSANTSVVYEITDGVTRSRTVTTGNIVGESIEVTDGLQDVVTVARFARGLSDGVAVEIVEN